MTTLVKKDIRSLFGKLLSNKEIGTIINFFIHSEKIYLNRDKNKKSKHVLHVTVVRNWFRHRKTDYDKALNKHGKAKSDFVDDLWESGQRYTNSDRSYWYNLYRDIHINYNNMFYRWLIRRYDKLAPEDKATVSQYIVNNIEYERKKEIKNE